MNPNRQHAGMRTADMEISDDTSEELEKRMDELAPKYADYTRVTNPRRVAVTLCSTVNP